MSNSKSAPSNRIECNFSSKSDKILITGSVLSKFRF